MLTLYVLDFGKNMVKVGVTENLSKRVAAIMCGSGFKDSPEVYKIEGHKDVILDSEQSVLTYFQDKAVNGEWICEDFDTVKNKAQSVFDELTNENSNDDYFKELASCFIDKTQVNLTRFAKKMNEKRERDGKPAYQLGAFLNSKVLEDYLDAASAEWNLDKKYLLQKGKKSLGATNCHVSVALLFAESSDVRAKVKAHKFLLSAKGNEYMERGGTEFRALNVAIDEYLPDRIGKDNKGVYIQIAKLIRSRILGSDAKTEDWNSARVPQTHLRYEWENKLCDMLRLGVVSDYQHLKSLISKL